MFYINKLNICILINFILFKNYLQVVKEDTCKIWDIFKKENTQ